MKKLMWLFVLAFPMAAQADYLDIIAGKLNPGCTMDKYLRIVQDFRDQWGNARGYKVEVPGPGAEQGPRHVLLGRSHLERRSVRLGTRCMDRGAVRPELGAGVT